MAKRKRTGGKRRNVKRRRTRKKRSIMKFHRSPLPLRFATMLKYCDQIKLDPGVAAYATKIYSGNGIYDPDISGVGHQPRGFDQLMPLYDHYVVIGSKITLRCVNQDTGDGCIVGVATLDRSTTFTAVNDYTESGSVTWRVMAPSVGSSKTTVTRAASARKFLGRSKMMSDPDLKGGVSNNPIEQLYYHVFTGPIDTSHDHGPVTIAVEIDYSVVFIEPKTPSQS